MLNRLLKRLRFWKSDVAQEPESYIRVKGCRIRVEILSGEPIGQVEIVGPKAGIEIVTPEPSVPNYIDLYGQTKFEIDKRNKKIDLDIETLGGGRFLATKSTPGASSDPIPGDPNADTSRRT